MGTLCYPPPQARTAISVRNEWNNLTTQNSLKPIRRKPCDRAVISSECFRFPPSWSHLSLRARYFYISVWYTCSRSHLALIVFLCLCGLSVAKATSLLKGLSRMRIYCRQQQKIKSLAISAINWQTFLCVALSSTSNWWRGDGFCFLLAFFPLPSMMTCERLL